MYSIIVPCYKSSETIAKVVATTAEEMNKMGKTNFEMVLVNDCSPDEFKTINKLREIANLYKFVKVVDLAKNVGQHNATLAGLRIASGDVFISMDDDMQTRPSELVKMFNAFDEGYDVVYGVYEEKKENLFRLFGSWVNKTCTVLFLNRPKNLQTSSFWIMRKYVRDEIVKYTDANTYLLGLILRTTSNITQVTVNHFEREAGSSGYNFKSLLRLWSNMIGFTVKPLRIALGAGMVIAICTLIVAVVLLIIKICNPSITAGWSSLMIGIFFSLGIQLIFIGLIGEYVGRTYLHVNKAPQYVIKNTINIDEKEVEKNG